MQNRKQFLKNSLLLSTGATLISSFRNFSILPDDQTNYYSFDLHCHPGQLFKNELPGFSFKPALQTVSDMKTASLMGAFFSLVSDAPLLQPGPSGISIKGTFEKGQAWTEYKRQMNTLKKFLQDNKVSLGLRKKDLEKSLTAFVSVEGGDFLEDDINNVDLAFNDGVRSIQFVHYAPNQIGDLQTAKPSHDGLSDFGKQVVRRMNSLGMVIDVAHADFQTVKEIASATTAPIILSHSILEMEPDRPIAQRAISKEHAKLVAGTGGLIGAWPSGFNKSFDEYIDNILRLVEVVGIDHVSIGTDMDANFKPVVASYKDFPGLANALSRKGLSVTEVGKIMGENAKAVLSKIFKA